MNIIKGTFDPISQKELEYLVNYRKENKIRDLWIQVKEEGILTKKQREELVEKAIQSYRHLHLYTGSLDGVTIPESLEVQEESIRHGDFYHAANGTKRILNEKGYYLQEITEYLCNSRRAIHSKGVADTAVILAKAHQKDPMLAYRMGMLHDITKKLPDEEGRKILETWYPEGLEIDPKVWHSFTAVFYLQQHMCIHDPKILNAIWHHTLGDGRSDWDAILYIADKIEPNRGYDSTYEMHLSLRNLQKGAAYVLQESKAYIYQKERKRV